MFYNTTHNITFQPYVDNLFSQSLHPVAYPRAPKLVLKTPVDCTKIDRTGFHGQDAGRQNLKGQETPNVHKEILSPVTETQSYLPFGWPLKHGVILHSDSKTQNNSLTQNKLQSRSVTAENSSTQQVMSIMLPQTPHYLSRCMAIYPDHSLVNLTHVLPTSPTNNMRITAQHDTRDIPNTDLNVPVVHEEDRLIQPPQVSIPTNADISVQRDNHERDATVIHVDENLIHDEDSLQPPQVTVPTNADISVQRDNHERDATVIPVDENHVNVDLQQSTSTTNLATPTSLVDTTNTQLVLNTPPDAHFDKHDNVSAHFQLRCIQGLLVLGILLLAAVILTCPPVATTLGIGAGLATTLLITSGTLSSTSLLSSGGLFAYRRLSTQSITSNTPQLQISQSSTQSLQI